ARRDRGNTPSRPAGRHRDRRAPQRQAVGRRVLATPSTGRRTGRRDQPEHPRVAEPGRSGGSALPRSRTPPRPSRRPRPALAPRYRQLRARAPPPPPALHPAPRKRPTAPSARHPPPTHTPRAPPPAPPRPPAPDAAQTPTLPMRAHRRAPPRRKADRPRQTLPAAPGRPGRTHSPPP